MIIIAMPCYAMLPDCRYGDKSGYATCRRRLRRYAAAYAFILFFRRCADGLLSRLLCRCCRFTALSLLTRCHATRRLEFYGDDALLRYADVLPYFDDAALR